MIPTDTTKNATRPLWRRASKVWLLIGIAVVLALVIGVVIEEASKTAPTPYSAFLDLLDAGNVASVTFHGTEIDGRFKQPVDSALSGGTAQQDTFISRVPDFGDPTLIPELRKQHVVIDVEPESSWSWLLSRIPWPILLFVGAMIVSGFVRLLRGRNSSTVSTLPAHGMMGLISRLFTKPQQEQQQAATSPTPHGDEPKSR
jgi:ATP-dependent Zn protease